MSQLSAPSLEKYTLQGYDTFGAGSPGEDPFYKLEGEYDTLQEAEKAADEFLQSVEESQPSESSGGQETEGVQDRVYIVNPDGSKYRYLPTQRVA